MSYPENLVPGWPAVLHAYSSFAVVLFMGLCCIFRRPPGFVLHRFSHIRCHLVSTEKTEHLCTYHFFPCRLSCRWSRASCSLEATAKHILAKFGFVQMAFERRIFGTTFMCGLYRCWWVWIVCSQVISSFIHAADFTETTEVFLAEKSKNINRQL